MNDRITNPDEAAAWAQPYGGIDRVEGPDANGIMTYYARTGPWVAVRRDGSFESQGANLPVPGSAPGSAPAAAQPTMPNMAGRGSGYAQAPGSQPEPASAPALAAETPAAPASSAPAAAPMGLTQDQLGAYLQQVARGGDVGTLNYEHGSHQKKVTTASGQHDAYVPFVRWIDLAARRVYEYDVNDDGSYTEVKPTVTVPAAPAATVREGQITTTEGTPTGQTDAQGNPIYDNEQPREVVRNAKGDLVSSKPLEGAALTAWKESRERSRNPGGQTDAEIRATQTSANAAAAASRAAANAATPSRDEKPVTINGKPYTLVSTENPVTKRTESHYEDANHTVVQPVTEPTSPYSEVRQDPDTKKWWGLTKDGKGWTEIPGGPGSAKPSGTPMPSMPEIVLGHSQDALRELKDKLQQGVAAGQWTQAQADNQWKDAYETAQTTVNEATVLNSKNQSELNASTNLANARLQASTSGFNNALNFIGKLNAALPAGSTLGAKAFMGLLGLQAMSAMQSGAYSGIVPGSQTLGGPSTYRSPTAIATPTSSVTAATVAAPVGGPTPPLNQGQDLSTPSAAPSSLPAAPARPAAATSAPPVAAGAAPPSAPSVPTASGTSPTAITAEQAAAYERGDINPATGDIDARGTPAGGAPQDTATIFQAGPRPLQPGDPGYPYQPQVPGAIPPASPIPSDVPQGVDQDMVTVRMPSGSGTMQVPRFMVGEGPGKYAPSQGWQVIEVPQSRMMAPTNDFAVLRGAPPGVALAPQAPPSAYEGLPDVVRRTAIAGQLPWRVSPEDIQWAEQNGYGADWRQMPGAAA